MEFLRKKVHRGQKAEKVKNQNYDCKQDTEDKQCSSPTSDLEAFLSIIKWLVIPQHVQHGRDQMPRQYKQPVHLDQVPEIQW